MKIWFTNQFKAVGFATALALMLTLVRVVVAASFQLPELASSAIVSYLLVIVAVIITSWRKRISLLFAWLVGYTFVWTTLFTLNTAILNQAYERSFFTVLVLMLVAPIPLALSASIGCLLGKIFPVPRQTIPIENSKQ